MIEAIVQMDGHVSRRHIAAVKQKIKALKRDSPDVAAAVDKILEMMAYAKAIKSKEKLELNPLYPASCLLAIRRFENSERGRALLSLMPEVNATIMDAYGQVSIHVNGRNGSYS